jgi:DNA-binding response OmpR family regulator
MGNARAISSSMGAVQPRRPVFMLRLLDGLSVLRAARRLRRATPVLIVMGQGGRHGDEPRPRRRRLSDAAVLIDECLARVRALLCRSYGPRDPVLRVADLTLDPAD